MVNVKQKFKTKLMRGDHTSYIVLFKFCSALVLVFLALIFIFRKGTTLGGIIEGGIIESVGVLFDIFILGVVFHYFKKKGEKQQEIERYKEEIDDFRDWNEKEAMFRNVGNIKRLVKLGVKNLPLYFCYLKDAKLENISLEGANFNGANLENVTIDGVKTNLDKVIFQGCKFNHIFIRDAKGHEIKFSGLRVKNPTFFDSDFSNAKISDCKFLKDKEVLRGWPNAECPYFINTIFSEAEITDSIFKEAYFKYTNFEDTEFHRVSFEGSSFDKVDFKNAIFNEVDFTNTKGLWIDQLREAKILYKVKGLGLEIENVLKEEKPELFEKPS